MTFRGLGLNTNFITHNEYKTSNYKSKNYFEQKFFNTWMNRNKNLTNCGTEIIKQNINKLYHRGKYMSTINYLLFSSASLSKS